MRARRARLASFVGLVLLSSSVLVLAPASAGHTLVVDPGNASDYATIQAAVDAAQPGDTVLIMPGVYHEQVGIQKNELTIRGADRATVILDGQTTQPACTDGLAVGITADHATNITIEDLTVRSYSSYGIWWYRVTGFYAHRVTAYQNCVYEIQASASTIGEVDHTESWGGGDSGLYVGETGDCACVLHDNDVHGNSIGYSGTRADHVEIRDNWFHDNGVGIVPNELPPDASELTDYVVKGAPFPSIVQCCLDIHHNLIEANNNGTVTPHGFTETFHLPVGTGVEVAGGSANLVYDNVFRGNARWGVALHWLYTPPNDNVVHDNVFEGSSQTDLWWDGWGIGNCFQNNLRAGKPATSDPSPPPNCGLLPSIGIPDPSKDANLALLALGHNLPVPVEGPLPIPELPVGYLP